MERMTRLAFVVNDAIAKDADDAGEKAGFPKGKQGILELGTNSLALFIQALDIYEKGGDIRSIDPDGNVKVLNMKPLTYAAGRGYIQRRLAEEQKTQ